MRFRKGKKTGIRPQGGSILRSLISRPVKRQLIYIVIATTFLLTGNGINQLQAEDANNGPEVKPIRNTSLIKEDAASQPSNNSCISCHNISSDFSHPIGVAPLMDIPSYFPLNKSGYMTCQTCHENTSAEDHMKADSTKRGLLRSSESGSSFCMECHQSSSRNPLNMHALVYDKAHPRKADNGNNRLIGTLRDMSSQTCLTCHDGSVATDAGYGMGMPNDPQRRARGMQTAHPVDIEYSSRQSDSYLRSEFNLDKRIRLNNGKVTCNSCHSLYSSEKSLLVMSNKKSSLCLSCHKY